MSSIKKTVNIKGKIYNKSSLSVDKAKTLIIVDWDDTLYPTSWVVNNKIDLTSPITKLKYTKYYKTLDICLSSTLNHLKLYGDILIITNAMTEWVELSLSVLPITKRVIEYIPIVSARARYQDTQPMSEWKKLT